MGTGTAPTSHARHPGCLPTRPGAGHGAARHRRTHGLPAAGRAGTVPGVLPAGRWSQGEPSTRARLAPLPWSRGPPVPAHVPPQSPLWHIPLHPLAPRDLPPPLASPGQQPPPCHGDAALAALAWDRRLCTAVPARDGHAPVPEPTPRPPAPRSNPGHLRHPRATRHLGPRRCRAGGLPAQAGPSAAQMSRLRRDERIAACLPGRRCWCSAGWRETTGTLCRAAGRQPPRHRGTGTASGAGGGDLWSSVPLSRA